MQESVRGSFFTPWSQVGGQFFLCPYSRRILDGSKRGYLRISGRASCQEKKQICVRTSPETQQLVKEMCPLDSCRLLFKLAVELDMVMNALAAGMEIPDEQLRTLRSRCIQDVKNRRQYLAGRCRSLSMKRPVISRTLFKFCVAKQRIKVLEKSSSYLPQSVVCVCVAESEKGDDTHGKA